MLTNSSPVVTGHEKSVVDEIKHHVEIRIAPDLFVIEALKN